MTYHTCIKQWRSLRRSHRRVPRNGQCYGRNRRRSFDLMKLLVVGHRGRRGRHYRFHIDNRSRIGTFIQSSSVTFTFFPFFALLFLFGTCQKYLYGMFYDSWCQTDTCFRLYGSLRRCGRSTGAFDKRTVGHYVRSHFRYEESSFFFQNFFRKFMRFSVMKLKWYFKTKTIRQKS